MVTRTYYNRYLRELVTKYELAQHGKHVMNLVIKYVTIDESRDLSLPHVTPC